MLTASCTPDLDDAAMVSVLQSNGFQNLKEFSAHDCGFLRLISVFLLVENCGNLHCIKGVGTWSGIQKEDMPELYRRYHSYYHSTGSLTVMPKAHLQYSHQIDYVPSEHCFKYTTVDSVDIVLDIVVISTHFNKHDR